LYPAHGPAFTDAGAAIERYRLHRTNRLNQVRQALTADTRDRDALLTAVYGDQVPAELQDFARAALDAYVEFLSAEQDVS
ncbi:MAG: MBL fold metallo-hydrolase, partial [Longimicrobiales bacterium]